MFFNQTQSLQKNPWSGLHVFSSQNSPEKTISTNTKQGSTGSTTSISMQQRKHLRILGEFVNYVRLTLDLILINLKHICLEDLARTKKNVKWMTWRDISVKFVTNLIWTKIVWRDISIGNIRLVNKQNLSVNCTKFPMLITLLLQDISEKCMWIMSEIFLGMKIYVVSILILVLLYSNIHFILWKQFRIKQAGVL